ncbi:helix-turn-helix domain-containing protein [Streptomyces bobili]|uniref:helix-turn-helix domain-containing protein n=1 Tax=Streptomyces TaxID=1883 RepID=UPI003723A334
MRYADGGGLTPAERQRREAVRTQAAELFEQKIKPPEAARRLGVSRKSAYQWHQLWRDGDPGALACPVVSVCPLFSAQGRPGGTETLSCDTTRVVLHTKQISKRECSDGGTHAGFIRSHSSRLVAVSVPPAGGRAQSEASLLRVAVTGPSALSFRIKAFFVRWATTNWS